MLTNLKFGTITYFPATSDAWTDVKKLDGKGYEILIKDIENKDALVRIDGPEADFCKKVKATLETPFSDDTILLDKLNAFLQIVEKNYRLKPFSAQLKTFFQDIFDKPTSPQQHFKQFMAIITNARAVSSIKDFMYGPQDYKSALSYEDSLRPLVIIKGFNTENKWTQFTLFGQDAIFISKIIDASFNPETQKNEKSRYLITADQVYTIKEIIANRPANLSPQITEERLTAFISTLETRLTESKLIHLEDIEELLFGIRGTYQRSNLAYTF